MQDDINIIMRRFHLKENENKHAKNVLFVPCDIEKTLNGYKISMIDGFGEVVEYVYLDTNEQIIKRDSLI